MKSISIPVHILLVSLVLIAGIVYVAYQAQKAEGSVSYGNEYTSRVYLTANVGTSSLARRGASLGSVVVTSASAVSTAGPYMSFYDTASTTIATTSLTAFAAMGIEGGTTPPAGTYTFDAVASTGIMVWVDPSYTGSYTITYR